VKNKNKIIIGIISGLVILASVLIPNIIHQNTIDKQIVKESKNVEIQKKIWADVVIDCDKWVKNDMTREELATEGHKLMVQYKAIKGDIDNDSTVVMSDSTIIKLETEVMLFDMVRGFEIKGNEEYSSKSKIKDETLKYVYDIRARTFNNLYVHFMEEYK